jgi:hypothetical protein
MHTKKITTNNTDKQRRTKTKKTKKMSNELTPEQYASDERMQRYLLLSSFFVLFPILCSSSVRFPDWEAFDEGGDEYKEERARNTRWILFDMFFLNIVFLLVPACMESIVCNKNKCTKIKRRTHIVMNILYMWTFMIGPRMFIQTDINVRRAMFILICSIGLVRYGYYIMTSPMYISKGLHLFTDALQILVVTLVFNHTYAFQLDVSAGIAVEYYTPAVMVGYSMVMWYFVFVEKCFWWFNFIYFFYIVFWARLVFNDMPVWGSVVEAIVGALFVYRVDVLHYKYMIRMATKATLGKASIESMKSSLLTKATFDKTLMESMKSPLLTK